MVDIIEAVAYHLFVFRNSDGHVGCISGFHFKQVPGPFDTDGRHGYTVLGRQTSVRSAEASFRLTAVVVIRIGHATRSELPEFFLVGATYERHVVIADTERCENSN